MDFVVVGLGVGALAVLLGLTMREMAPRWWARRPDDSPAPVGELAHRLAIGRASRAGGLVLSLAGGVIVLVTVIALVLGVSDRVGAIVVMAVISAAVLGGIAWGMLFTHRYLPRPRRRPLAVAPEEPPSLAATIEAAIGHDADTPREDATAPAASQPEPAPLPADEAVTAPAPPVTAEAAAAVDTGPAAPRTAGPAPPAAAEADTTGRDDEPPPDRAATNGVAVGDGRSRPAPDPAAPKDRRP